jgi:predicted O-methyltransferase YrrM
MLFQIKSYLKFLWYSTNEHAVHSPFVFNLVTKCFYDTKYKPNYATLHDYRSYLLRTTREMEIINSRTHSKIFNPDRSTIKKTVKSVGINPKHAKLLLRITDYFQPNMVLEIGTSPGIATSALALGNKTATITTLHNHPDSTNIVQSQLENFGIGNVTVVGTAFEKYFSTVELHNVTFDFIYFGYNNSKNATLDYFEVLLATINNETVWIFENIHESKEIEKAWLFICRHPKVTVSIDTFRWGLVFFRTEQNKQHFIIRI